MEETTVTEAVATENAPAQASQASSDAGASELDTLRAQNTALQQELTRLKNESAQYQRQQKEQAEFRRLYPNVEIAALPRQVTEASLPLSAAYALYCREQECQALAAEEKNLANAQAGSGAVRHDGEGDREFTVEEVRRMSPEAVRRNYPNILRSLKKWK